MIMKRDGLPIQLIITLMDYISRVAYHPLVNFLL